MKYIKKIINEVQFPCLKEELMGTAKQHGADKHVLGKLERVPAEFFSSEHELLEYL